MSPKDQEKIERLIKEADERPEITDLIEAIKEQARTREMHDAFDEVKKALYRRHEWLSVQVVPKLMEESDILSTKVAGVGRVHLKDDVYVSTPKDRKAEAFEWFRDHGFGDLIQETINGSTLAAWVRKRIKNGEEIPEAVKVTPYTKAVITKS